MQVTVVAAVVVVVVAVVMVVPVLVLVLVLNTPHAFVHLSWAQITQRSPVLVCAARIRGATAWSLPRQRQPCRKGRAEPAPPFPAAELVPQKTPGSPRSALAARWGGLSSGAVTHPLPRLQDTSSRGRPDLRGHRGDPGDVLPGAAWLPRCLLAAFRLPEGEGSGSFHPQRPPAVAPNPGSALPGVTSDGRCQRGGWRLLSGSCGSCRPGTCVTLPRDSSGELLPPPP